MQELKTEEDIERFVNSQPGNVLTVVNVSSNDTPCIRVFAAVLALAKNFAGYAAFARLMYDSSPQSKAVAKQLNVLQVGTTTSPASPILSTCRLPFCFLEAGVIWWSDYYGNFCMGRGVATSCMSCGLQVPTFIFYRGGKEVGRHVGSSRGDLIGQILQQQNALGIAPPPPPVKAGSLRRRAANA